MKITMSDSLGPSSIAITEHRGIELHWNTSPFERTTFSGDFDIFEQINGYWGYLPEASQDQIFDVYQQIHEAFAEASSSRELTLKLRAAVAELYRFHSQEDIHHWASFHAELRMPASIKDVAPSDLPRERTYLTDDYRRLITLSISLRPMLPIWGEFIFVTKKENGAVFKEFYAHRLLKQTNLVRSDSFKRLQTFVQCSVPTEKSISSAILGGVGTENFPEWMLGLVMVRRLAVGDVRGFEPDDNLVRQIFKYIIQKVKGHDSSFSGIVKDKPKVDQRSEGENNISVAEGYKIKEAIPAGDIVVLSYYTRDIERMTRVIEPNIDSRLIVKSINSVKALANEQIHECQTTLMQWVMADALPPRGLMRLNKTDILNVLAATQAILWHQARYELAALVSAVQQKPDEDAFVTGGESKARLTKEQVERLNELYPHFRRSGSRAKQTRQPNAAITALENVNDQFSDYDWRLTLPLEWVERVTGSKNRRYATPYEMKQKLADLVIAIASKEL